MLKKMIKTTLWGIVSILVIIVIVFLGAGLIPANPYHGMITGSKYVQMKDGTRLAVKYYLPSEWKEGDLVPAIMESTRYGTEKKRSFLMNALVNLNIAHEIRPIHQLSGYDYALIEVQNRGSGASFGSREMEFSREEVEDLGQMIDWISKQPWSNGKVFAFGISFGGNMAELATVSNHPALTAIAPLFSDFDPISYLAFPGGIYNQELIKDWTAGNSSMDANEGSLFFEGAAPVDGDQGEELLKEAVAGHLTFDISAALKKITYFDQELSEGYRVIDISPYIYKNEIEKSSVPMFVRVGWQDAGTVNGAIERFLTFSNSQSLQIGPWNHSGIQFYDPFLQTSYTPEELTRMQADEVISFFDRYLDGNMNRSELNEKSIRYYTLGEGVWKTTATWPLPDFDTKKFYFDQKGQLQETQPEGSTGKDIYRVDFTATTGQNNRWFTNFGAGPIIYPDRAEEDKKLLVYTSEAFENDVEITGNPVVTLNLSSNCTDGGFFVYFEDVSPEGVVTYITEGQLRALHRKITSEPIDKVILGPTHSYFKKDGEALIPGENAELKIGMYATSVLIKKGHRIRVALAGHDAASFAPIQAECAPMLEIQRNNNLASYIELPFLIRK
ncbi:MAG: CocE/NonD family hydrolase [Anaerolineaceae bacterium]